MRDDRDDFSLSTRTLLAKRAGYICSRPSCRANTVGPSRESPEAVASIGVAAHICAAAPGGPRWDANMSSNERRSPANGIWLCASDATLVDRDTVRFPAHILRRWKVDHERYVESQIGTPTTKPAIARLNNRRISEEAARVALERLPAWEYALVAQILRDEVADSREHLRDLKYGIVLGGLTTIEPAILTGEFDKALDDARSFLRSMRRLVEVTLSEAAGPLGAPGDPDLLAYVAHRLGDVYRAAISWSRRWHHTKCPWRETRHLLSLLPRLMEGIRESVVTFSEQLDAAVEAGLARNASALGTSAHGGEAEPIHLTLRPTFPEGLVAEITSEFRRLAGHAQDLVARGLPYETEDERID